jgi:hypothetical protein
MVKSKIPVFRALPTMLSSKGPENISGNRVKISTFMWLAALALLPHGSNESEDRNWPGTAETDVNLGYNVSQPEHLIIMSPALIAIESSAIRLSHWFETICFKPMGRQDF